MTPRMIHVSAVGEAPPNLPIVSVDFDGVVHRYERGWDGGQIRGTMVPGFMEWLLRAQGLLRVVIFSSRSSDEQQRLNMVCWLEERAREWRAEHPSHSDLPPMRVEMWHSKPPALVTIDDRAICFCGNWLADELRPESLLKFRPWTASMRISLEAADIMGAEWFREARDLAERATAILQQHTGGGITLRTLGGRLVVD